MSEVRYTELIAKKLSGEITKSEDKKLAEWLKDPRHFQIYTFYQSIWKDTAMRYRTPHPEKVYAFISDAINDTQKRNFRAKTRNGKPLQKLWLAAAVLSFAIVSAFTFYYLMPASGTRGKEENEVMMHERALPKGQKLKIFLPDGSIVWLNAESKLRYPERFAVDSRVVYLEGEAYFEVDKDAEKPFSVQTPQLTVTALGTSFNVRDYSFEENVQVALNTGKVAVDKSKTSGERLILNPGEGAFFNKNQRTIRKAPIDRETCFLWRKGILYFHEASFQEVLDRLSRWYGIEFEVSNFRDQRWSYTGRFEPNEYLSNVLKSISYTKGFEYKIDQNKVYIKF